MQTLLAEEEHGKGKLASKVCTLASRAGLATIGLQLAPYLRTCDILKHDKYDISLPNI